MKLTYPRKTGYVARRTVLRNCLVGLGCFCMSNLLGAFTPPLSFSQDPLPSRQNYDGWICAYDLIGATADPLVYYYYAGDCPTDDGQYYGMTAPDLFPTSGGCPSDAAHDPGCNLRYSPLQLPSKQLPSRIQDTLIDRSTNPMKRHFVMKRPNNDLGQTGLPKLGGTNLTMNPNLQSKAGVTVIDSRNYQMMINGRRRAVRVFVLDVVAGAPKKHVKVGIGQEIDADPTGLPVFDDERPGTGPKHYMGYMKSGDQFFHILTKN